MENVENIKPSLSDDVIELEILPKLPPSSLNRFKLVSRKWYSLITADSYFITLSHLHPHSNSLLVIAIPRANKPTNFGVFFISRDLSRLVTVDMSYMRDCPTNCPDSVGKINHYVECYNGLVCFTDYNKSIVIWNPATRESKHLPQPLPTEDDHFLLRHIGFTLLSFGFDEGGNDYKLVRVAQPWRKDPTAQVFSLRRNSWRHVEKGLPHGTVSHSCRVNVNGVLYWMGCRSKETKDYFVLSFDLRSEEFREINLPPVCMDYMDDDEYDDREPDLIKWKDSLGLLVHDDENCSRYYDRVLWLMDRDCGPGPERSWTKLGKVLRKPNGLWFGAIRNDRFVMSRFRSSSCKRVCNQELYLYEPFSQLETSLPIREREDICAFTQVFDYSESLVSLSLYTGGEEGDCSRFTH
ncbi:F-box domain containing protein [Trema orientale]|uniref:F-box domain containing protein n=1 Tax=Trema orientale TaxID=63057 RepID=A0A2P5EH24_TREOI|nr:F-box domain containing protein [Trema orientale]